MKNLLIPLALIFGSTLYGQTDSIEKAILYNKALSKEIGQVEYSRIALKWKQAMKEIKKYPELPLDQNGKVHYSFLYNYTDLNKEKLFTRTLEWLSINYGLVPSYIYNNQQDGRIIFRNSINLNYIYNCNYTSVISIKDGKILMEIINIGYQAYFEGHYSNDIWIPERTSNFNISQMIPIILKDPTDWNTYFYLLLTTNELLDIEKENLNSYIMSYDYSYQF